MMMMMMIMLPGGHKVSCLSCVLKTYNLHTNIHILSLPILSPLFLAYTTYAMGRPSFSTVALLASFYFGIAVAFVGVLHLLPDQISLTVISTKYPTKREG